ncbi:MAG: DUF1232 domain-containing protein [Clostridia bacterium]|nr:DUF1232 domain-containing protein [Clostridia bacterium]
MAIIKKSFWPRVRFLLNLPKSLPLAWKLLLDKRLPLQNKLFFIGLSVFYLLLPIDLIPDLPLLGQLDDFSVFMILFNWFLNQVPKEILADYGWYKE